MAAQYDDDVLYINYDEQDDIPNPELTKTYENNTFIDWYTETKNISKSSSLTTKKWLTIIITAVLMGYIVTFIDLSSVWLNDLRKGLCLSQINRWSLLNPYSSCPVDDWNDWSEILFNSSKIITSAFVNYPIYVILGLVLSVLAIYISEADPCIQQSGIPEVKEIIQGLNYNLNAYLGLKTLLFKIFGLVLMVSSGFWLGKEGPLVHVTCCLINFIYNLLFGAQTNEAVRRELFSAATATGICLAFNSPIGGVLFVLECIPSYFNPTKIMWNSFVSAAVSLIVLVGFRLFTEGGDFNEQDLFSVEFGNFSWFIIELGPFILLGILGGLYGHYFISLYSKFSSNNFRSRLQSRICHVLHISPAKGNYVEIIGIFLLTSLLNYPLTITRLPLNAFLKLLFKDCPSQEVPDDSNSTNFMCSASDFTTLAKLLYISIQGFCLSVYTFGTILPGGVLMPSLVLGATCGRFIGILSRLFQTHVYGALETCTSNSCLVSPSSYAVIGAGAFFTGITKLTMCVVVILFELTGAVSYVLPIMIGVMISKFVSDYLSNENIYDAWLKYNFNSIQKSDTYNEGKGNGLCNYSIATSAIKTKLPDISVAHVMVQYQNTKCIYLVPDMTYSVGQLYSFLSDDNHEGYPVVTTNEEPICLGYINKQKIYHGLNLGNLTNDMLVSFQVQDCPSEIASLQSQIYSKYPDILRIDLEPEKPFIIMNDQTSFRLLIDVFEKMYLNYLIINKSKCQTPNVIAGFIDRFILAKLIDGGFQGLDTFDDYVTQFDIEAGEGEDDLLMDRQRSSIELIT